VWKENPPYRGSLGMAMGRDLGRYGPAMKLRARLQNLDDRVLGTQEPNPSGRVRWTLRYVIVLMVLSFVSYLSGDVSMAWLLQSCASGAALGHLVRLSRELRDD
jgi:hypothetical protein